MNQFSLFFVLALVWLGVFWFGFRLPLLGKQCADQMHCERIFSRRDFLADN